MSHNIDVGKGGIKFTPSTTTAAIGDTLQFHFYTGAGSHSVVEGMFSSPCVPTTNAFFSGYIPGSTKGEMTFVVNVTSTDPIWFYCSLASHCADGMVGVVNPPADQTIEQYAAAAQSIGQGSAPASVAGGVVTTISESDDSSTSMSMSTSMSTTMAMTSSGSGSAATVSATTTSGSASAAKTGSATSSSASTSATTTPNGAVHAADMSVMLGLTVVLGGLVALLA